MIIVPAIIITSSAGVGVLLLLLYRHGDDFPIGFDQLCQCLANQSWQRLGQHTLADGSRAGASTVLEVVVERTTTLDRNHLPKNRCQSHKGVVEMRALADRCLAAKCQQQREDLKIDNRIVLAQRNRMQVVQNELLQLLSQRQKVGREERQRTVLAAGLATSAPASAAATHASPARRLLVLLVLVLSWWQLALLAALAAVRRRRRRRR